MLPAYLHAQGSPPLKAPSPRKIGQPDSPSVDPSVVLKTYEKDIKRDVARLLELAQDLKKDADKLSSITGLNGAMAHTAEEIEKLAHKISGMARG
jgi:hypothetical protein